MVTSIDLSVTLHFASTSCNRRPNALSSLPSQKLAAFASHNNIVVLSTTTYAVISVLPVTRAPINCVKLIDHDGVGIFLVAVAEDGFMTIFQRDFSQTSHFHRVSSHALHSTSCNSFDVVHGHTPSTPFLLSSISDTELTLWEVSTEFSAVVKVASHSFLNRSGSPSMLLESVTMHRVDSQHVLIALSGSDRHFHLFHSSPSCNLEQLCKVPAHKDWIRALTFAPSPVHEPILATASADNTVRLFRIHKPVDGDPPQPLHLQFSLGNTKWEVKALALLDEHTAPVHTVSFLPPPETSTPSDTPLHLLTSSLDGTVAVWQIDLPNPICAARFGLLGGHSAHAPGFFGAIFSKDDPTEIIAHSFTGALHRWSASPGTYTYSALPAVAGHFHTVTDIAWSPDGSFLLSASMDKTARIFAPDQDGRFYECARPQVHGHALFAVAFCSRSGLRYVSGAEERMLRVFDAPSAFHLPGCKPATAVGKTATSASLPELGLSNTAIFAQEQKHKGSNGDGTGDVSEDVATSNRSVVSNDDMRVVSFGVQRAEGDIPLEEDLKQKTLWPEAAKLYGHGHEIVSVATDPDGSTLASACHAQAAKDAEIILWDPATGVEAGRLRAHELTVTQLRFSPSGKSLLSVSRDRSVFVYERQNEGNGKGKFDTVLHLVKAHTRGIFSCTWVTESLVATGGRDKFLRLFNVSKSEGGSKDSREIYKRKFESSVTALDCLCHGEQNILSIGLESGDWLLVALNIDDGGKITADDIFHAGEFRCGGRITQTKWQPKPSKEDKNESDASLLGFGSEDQSVRVYHVMFTVKEGLQSVDSVV